MGASSETLSNRSTPSATRSLSRAAFWLGVLAAVSYVLGWILVAWVLPGNVFVIGLATVLDYLVPIVGLIVGHVARRREGRERASTVGLVLSYLFFAAAVIPLLLAVLVLVATP